MNQKRVSSVSRVQRSMIVLSCLAATMVVGIALCGAEEEPKQWRFDQRQDAQSWKLQNGAEVDETRTNGPVGGSLRVPPGARATLPLRSGNGAGRVDLWVYDDLSAPKDAKARRGGPQWGLIDAAGRVLVVGAIYAPYLSGNATYAAADYDSATEKPWHAVQYLGLRREPRWRQWVFDMDAEKGLSIRCDGKDVNAAQVRFNWNLTKFEGFTGVVVIGDEAEGNHTLWIDDVTATLGGTMKARPTPPPPPPPVVPDKDPALEGEAPRLLEPVAGKHPGLLLTAADLPRLKAFAAGDGKLYWDRLVSYLPTCIAPDKPTFLTDATDGQRQGFWRLPTVALHALLTDDATSLQRARDYLALLLKCDNWETGAELDSGMSAGNVMAGAALAYDWLYPRLDPAFRDAFRSKLIYHARAMYHGGHLGKAQKIRYWQNDPQNNHRWHRNAGLTLAVLAAYEGNPDEQWILAKAIEDLHYVARWLPEDGTSHESATYMIFGGAHLTIAMDAADKCLGTTFLQHPFFRNVGPFLVQMLPPGLVGEFLPYGDSTGGMGDYGVFLYRAAAVHQQPLITAMLDRFYPQSGHTFAVSSWMALLWAQPTSQKPDFSKLPRAALFEDVGNAMVREGWEADDKALMFRCGPLGGYKLNAFRAATAVKGQLPYINVAHDDPDANSLVLWSGGALVLETDRYSSRKQSSNCNTILVNGMGQMAPGRMEPQVFSQPSSPNHDMRDMAVLTTWKDAGDVVVVEGEAAGSYLAVNDRGSGRSRPALERFRRAVVWVKGQYVLVLDDIVAPQEVRITWLMQAPQLVQPSAGQLRFVLSHDKAQCPLLVRSDGLVETSAVIVPSSADNKGKPLGWQQLQLEATTPRWRLASLLLPWGGESDAVITASTRESMTVRVSVGGREDTWTWTGGGEGFEPYQLTGRGGVDVAVATGDRAPRPERKP